MLRIGIVAGEASGDMLAAGIIRAIRQRCPSLVVEGLGGPEMEAAGCSLIQTYDRLAVMGLVEVAGRYLELRSLRRSLVEHFRANPPDVFIGVDAPDFNLGLEQALRQSGIRTVHCVSPSVWAWRAGRVNTIKTAVDRILVLLPFEQAVYESRGIPVDYIGHPMADVLDPEGNRDIHRSSLGLPQDTAIVALMPGSRQTEIDRMLPLYCQTADQCLRQRQDLIFISSVLTEQAAGQVESAFRALRHRLGRFEYRLYVGRSREVLGAADAGLLTSGTITLEAMLCGLPMAVAYRMNSLSAMIIRRMVRVRHASLPNLLAGREIVREFIQGDCRPRDMAAEILQLLDGRGGEELAGVYRQLHRTLKMNANARAAEAILAMTEERS